MNERLTALDVFRGLTIASMLLVNDPGSWSAIYPPLEHAPWHGWTPTDLIFPFFLFIVGVTTHLSLSKRDPESVRGKIIRRGLLIVLVGLLLHAFPLDQPSQTLAAWTDRLILGTNHIWASSKTWDPEGPLSTIPAIATAMLGVLAGRWITQRERPLVERIAGLYGAGCLGMVAGL